ncbi:PfaD family polyunsaturated fatty acid/polyketide biosynthesis protein [Streptomyces sp. NPDC057238]|uniref:PfaD family polyunsaturated fatty acid/polyketide biosynthesis protein n=1 Tax=Streptomyces sp. NPDC057238 TaxID=3346060 RepID=UPI00363D0137
MVWFPGDRAAAYQGPGILPFVAEIRSPLHLVGVQGGAGVGVAIGGRTAPVTSRAVGLPWLGTLPPIYPEWLGDRSFTEAHGARFPYAGGEMAGGIATVAMVVALAEAGLFGFFGSGGLLPDQVETAAAVLAERLGGRTNWGINLLHAPNEPALENRIADIALRHRVPAVSASAFMGLTPAVVRLAATGLHRSADGQVNRRTRVFAKISRPEVAHAFLSPPPADILRALVGQGLLTETEAELAARLPVAEDVTVEADSGGHTDNRPLSAVLPAIAALRDTLVAKHGYGRPVRVGAAGGLGTPAAVACAFALGAAYVVTGSINQTAQEAALSPDAKAMLAEAGVTDTAMGVSADMFELGAKVQVLGRGTLFAARSNQLHELYRRHSCWADIPADQRERIEREILRAPFDTVWSETLEYWRRRDPRQAERAERDLRHRMALVFRWYLGMASRWAVEGHNERKADYQIWCGPAMGAFNRWAKGGFLAEPRNRGVVQIALNLLEGAAVLSRAQQLRAYGVAVPTTAFTFTSRLLA